MSKPKVPNTISDKQMAALRRRAQNADKEPWTSRRAVNRRLNATKQAKNSRWS